MRGCLGHDAAAHLVTGEATVAIDEAGVGRDDKRRVRHDEVEFVAGDRLEQVAFPYVDVVAAVQTHRERGESDRAWIAVGGDHLTRVALRVQGLDARSGAEVETAADVGPNRYSREGERGRAHAEHVIRGSVATPTRVTRHDPLLV